MFVINSVSWDLVMFFSQVKVWPLIVIEPPVRSIFWPSIKRDGVLSMSMRWPMPISKLIFFETFSEAMSELNFSRSPLPPVTSTKYLLKRSLRSEPVA